MAWRSSNSLPWRSEEGVFKHEAKNNRRRGRGTIGRPGNLRGATAGIEIAAWAGRRRGASASGWGSAGRDPSNT